MNTEVLKIGDYCRVSKKVMNPDGTQYFYGHFIGGDTVIDIDADKTIEVKDGSIERWKTTTEAMGEDGKGCLCLDDVRSIAIAANADIRKQMTLFMEALKTLLTLEDKNR